jgi:NAD(P)-dependent dehydrogenase (short-subunit alcohol dehydrogenase family)
VSGAGAGAGGRFAGRVVVVTGGASGIGAASARLFAEEDAQVAVVDRAEPPGREASQSQRIRTYTADVSDERELERALASIEQELGGIDVMYANAAVESTLACTATTIEHWNQVMAVNATGTFLACRFALRSMVARGGGGSIVITASTRAFITGPDSCSYSASKGALVALMRGLAMEGAPYNVRVNAVLPGAIRTPMLEREAAGSTRPAEEQLRRWAKIHPLGRLGEASDIAHAVAFLASDAAAFITGAALPVDGGMMAAEPGGPPVMYSEGSEGAA